MLIFIAGARTVPYLDFYWILTEFVILYHVESLRAFLAAPFPFTKIKLTFQYVLRPLYYYMRNFCSLIGLEQWYFSLIWNTYMWKLQTFCG